MKKIGKISHYYDKIGVAILDLEDSLKVGDQVKITGHDSEFIEQVTSIQVEHEQIEKGEKGQQVGLKVSKPVKENDTVFLLEN